MKKTTHGGPRPGAGRKPLTPEEQEKKRLRRNEAARNRRAKAAGKAAGTPAPETPATVPAAPKGPPAGAWADPRAMQALMDQLGKRARRSRAPQHNPFQVAQHPPSATPRNKKLQMALDSGTTSWAANSWLAGAAFGAVGAEGLQFLGYPFLSELAQRPEYRTFSETIADDATRKWIDFDVTGTIEDKEKESDDEETEEADEAGQPVDPGEEKQKREDRVKSSGKMEKVKQLKDELTRLELRDCLYKICRDDGFFGRSHLYLDFGEDLEKSDSMEELKTPIGDGRDDVSRGKVSPRHPLKAVRTVEPVWCYPTTYNAINPLRDDWYNPQVWYVMGREIHKSRLPTFIGRPVPDLLKPAYSFGGLSLSQLAMPYVDIWLQTRESVGELIHSFSVMVLMTDVQTNLAPGANGGPGSLMARVAAFNDFRDNMNTFVVNKNTEDFKNVSAPLGGLHELQAQAQEHMMCLSAGTLIETDRGQVPIEKVTLKDRVMTRNGFAPLQWAGQTGTASEMVEIRAADSVVRATGWHPIWSETTREFVNAENVDRSHRLLRSTSWENTAPLSLGAAAGGGRPRPGIIETQRLAGFFTAGFTKLTWDLFLKASTFITSMTIPSTTAFQISSFLLVPSTTAGTSSRTAASASTATNRKSNLARIVAPSSQPSCRPSRSTAPAPASAPLSEPVAVASVRVIEGLHEPVYNLEVAEGYLPEFFANGILVHNSVARIPDVKFTGINPSGLNASTDGTMRAYYDTIAAYQNRFMRPNLVRIVNFVQLSLWGEIDPEITFEFEDLWEMSEKEKSELQKTEAERNQTYVDMGVLAPEEIRGVLIDDPELPFGDLDPDDVPELKQEEEGGLIPPDGGKGIEAVLGEPGGPGQPAGGAPAGEAAPPKAPHGDPAFQEEGGAAAGGAKVLPFKARGAADGLDPIFASLVGDAAIEWNEPDHPRDEKGEFTAGAAAGKASHAAQTGASAPKPKGYGWHGGPAQYFVMPQFGLSGPPSSFGEGHHWKPEPAPPLDPSALKRVGKQMGSNPGGVFEDEKGRKFYVKEGRSKDHVRNEMTAADLYALAGAPTLNYREVAGGAHIASEMEKLSKSHASELSDAERKKAKRDFAAHAWTANYDAVGTGGDNLVAVHGEPFSVDLGGALEYRAQGKPKGAAFGNQVTELDSMRDPGIAPDASKVFGDITPSEFRESAARVTRISDAAIRGAVKARGGTDALADKMIARRDDIAKRAKTFGAEGKPEKKTSTVIFPAGDALPVKTLNGVAFKPWKPPADGDWNEVDGQMDIEDEEPLPESAKGKQLASGLIIKEKDGRVWLARPKGGFGGYDHTFPKGRVEHSLSMQANAIKEAFEETGLKAKITGHAGDREGDVTLTRYYTAEREAGDPSQPGDESEGVVLAPADKLDGFLNRDRDRKLAKEIAGGDGDGGKKPPAADAQDEEPGAPRTLYINRPLLNADELIAWAHERGIKKTLPREDIHVTVTFSKAPVMWAEVRDDAAKVTVRGEQNRSVERLGDKGAVVLRFESPNLSRRWDELRALGASWDYPTYKPHVTITYNAGDVDIEKLEPYAGLLEFGPEVFAEVEEGWHDKVELVEDAFEEGKHKRGQPENKGQFGPGGGGGGQAKRTSAGRPAPRKGSGAVLRSQSQGAAQAVASQPKHDSGKLLEKATADALAKATPKQKEAAADHDKRTKEFFASEPARKSMAKAVTAFAKKHAAAFANYHLTDAILLPGIHHVVEQAVSAIGLDSVSGLTLGATAVAAYAANQLIERYHLNLTGAKELLAPVLRGAIDVLGNVKDTSARIADLEKRGLVGAEDENRDPSVLDSLILLLIEVEKLGEEDGQAQDEAPFEESKHPRDAKGEFASKGNEGAGGESGEEEKNPDGKKVSTSDIVEKAVALAAENGMGLGDLSPLQSAQHKYNAAIQLGSNYASATWATTTDEDDALKQVYGSTEDAWKALAEKANNPGGTGFQGSFATEMAKIDNAEGEYGDLHTNLKSAEAKVKVALEHNATKDDLIAHLTNSEHAKLMEKYGSTKSALEELSHEAAEGEPKDYDAFEQQIEGLLNNGGEPSAIELANAHPEFVAQLKDKNPGASALLSKAYETDKEINEEIEGEAAAAPAKTDKKTKFGGLWKVSPDADKSENANIQYNAGYYTQKPTNAGSSYRSMLAYLIKNGPGAGLDAGDVDQLRVKLVQALYMAEAKAVALGKADDVKKIGAALGKIAGAYPSMLDAGFKAFEAKKEGKPAPIYKPSSKEMGGMGGKPFNDAVKKIDDTVGESLDAAELKAKAAIEHGATLKEFQDSLGEMEMSQLLNKHGSLSDALMAAAPSSEETAAAVAKHPAESLAAAGEAEKPGNAAAIAKAKAIVASGVDPQKEPEKFWSQLDMVEQNLLTGLYGSGGNVQAIFANKSASSAAPQPQAYVDALAKFHTALSNAAKTGYAEGIDSAKMKAKIAAANGIAATDLIDMLTLKENQALKAQHGSISNALNWADKEVQQQENSEFAQKLIKEAEASKPAPSFNKMSDIEKFVPAYAEKLKQIATAYPVASINSSSAKIIAALENNATLAALEVALKPAEKKKLEAKWGTLQTAWEKYGKSYGPNSPVGKQKAAAAQAEMPIAVNAEKPTDAELTKAKKTAPLQLQYVPNAPAGSAEAQKLVDEFNAKWSGKEVSDADALEKIADFKAMAEKMKPLMSEAQKKAAEQNAKIAEEAKKSQAEQAAKAAAETAKHAADLAEYKKDLGISDVEAQGFEGLVSMLGKSKSDLINEFKKSDVQAGHGISKFEGALIRTYKQSSSVVNKEMRKPEASWTEPQVMFAKVLNKALGKLPGYKGQTIRNTPLSTDLQMRYQPGKIVFEHGFTGTSKVKPNGIFDGNTRFYVTGIGKRAGDISQMHGFENEQEVLYQAHTMFRVDKVEGQVGNSSNASYKVWMTEVEM